ncbi:MAG TPA: YetF domain-containing protein [Acidimicrobiia bacterium]|nr:YetF domain-containing protein [Acidimicrobiia bacterium]
MIEDWLSTSATEVGLILLSSLIIYLAVILVVRLNGLRSFSKMSSFDFAVTVAIGSLVASVAATSTSLTNGIIAVAAIMLFQRLVAAARRNSGIEKVVDNQPILLMAGAEILTDNMRLSRITPGDLRAKLREAGITEWSQVRAVILETTGDVSVLSGESLDPSLLEGVIGVERLETG